LHHYCEYGEKWKKINWRDKVTNEEVIRTVNEFGQILDSIWQWKHRWIDYTLRHNGLMYKITEGRMRYKPKRGRRIHILQDLANNGGYFALK